MMPPHVDRTVPREGEPLVGSVIEFHGWSLAYTDPGDLEAFDETAGAPVRVETDLTVESVGEGLGMKDPLPGSIQEKSVLRVRIPGIAPGHTYRVRLLDATVRVTAAGAVQP